jgi:signal transduction histidine kinase
MSTVGLDVRRVVTARFASLAVLLSVAMGLGLFLVAGVRGTDSWSLFALACLAGVVGVAWSVRAALGRGPDGVGSEVRPAIDGEPRLSSGPVAEKENPRSATGPNGVDYLMALRHEFRTPLNAVLGFSDVLLSGIDGEVNDSQREDLEIIRGSGIRLRVLLDSALDLSQIADGELRLDLDRADVRELVARVAVEAGQLWSNKRTAICTLPEAACFTSVDEARLRRSILVLADFLAAEHRDANIVLSVVLSGDHVSIELSADPSDRLTLVALPTPAEVLASEDATEVRRWPVAVTSEVVALHHGSLYHGGGPSRFRIRLPLRSVG